MRQHTVVKAFFCAIICATISSLHRFTSTLSLASMASLAAVTALLASPSAQAQYSATPTSFSVTDAGASSLSIPIYTPPMPGGIDVKLSLQYNSQASNGVFGVGWNLSGVSSITRCPKTIAEEGERIGVKNDATDVFCLDGQKLRAVAGAYGAAGTEYRTAIDSYSQIISNGNHWGGPLGFTVKTKSGAIMEFGGLDGAGVVHNSNLPHLDIWSGKRVSSAGVVHNSNLPHPSKNLTRVWMLKSIKDRTNNTISFTYTTDPTLGEQRLLFVEFNNNGYLFVDYQDRGPNDAILKYDDGVQMGSTIKRANKIVINDYPVAAGGSRPARPFKEYRLNYSQSTTTQRSLLTSVQECANDGACLPAVTMDYNSAGQVAFTPGATVDGANGYQVTDFEGDGKASVTSLGEARVWDIDNDGKTDYTIDSKSHGSDTGSYIRTQWLSSTGKSTIIARYDVSGHSAASGVDSTSVVQVLGSLCYADLNGDGLSDQIRFNVAGRLNDRAAYEYYMNSSLGGSILIGRSNTTGNNGASPVFLGPSCQTTDIDGDGKAELIIPMPVGMDSPRNYEPRAKYVVTFKNGVLQLSPAFLIGAFDNTFGTAKQEHFGDFNGDGKTDILYLQGGTVGSALPSSTAKVAYFTNDSVTQITESGPMTGPSINYGGVLCAADFDGDGKTDVLGLYGASFTLHLSRSNQFQIVPVNLQFNITQGPVFCADFNGDGLADVFYNKQYWYNTLPVAPDALKSTSNGLGHYYSVDYSSITNPDVYAKGGWEVLPIVNLQTPIPVVRYVTDNAGVGPVRTRYQYYGLKADLQRRGTLGFKTVQSINETTGITDSTDYYQTYPLIGLKERSQKWLNDFRFQETTYGYLTRGIGGGALTPQGAQVEVNNIVTVQMDINSKAHIGTSRDTVNDIDSLGNPRFTEHYEYDAAGALISSKTTTEYTYTNNTANWLIGQVISSKTTSTNLRSLPITMVGASAGADAASQSGQPPPPPVVPLTLGQKAAMAVISNLLLAD
jgi:hypothetical protein